MEAEVTTVQLRTYTTVRKTCLYNGHWIRHPPLQHRQPPFMALIIPAVHLWRLPMTSTQVTASVRSYSSSLNTAIHTYFTYINIYILYTVLYWMPTTPHSSTVGTSAHTARHPLTGIQQFCWNEEGLYHHLQRSVDARVDGLLCQKVHCWHWLSSSLDGVLQRGLKGEGSKDTCIIWS